VIGSMSLSQQDELQHDDADLPVATCWAARAYLSLTASLMELAFSAIWFPQRSFPKSYYRLGLDSSISRTALRIKKAEQLSQCFRIDQIPKEGSFAVHSNQSFVAEFVQVVRECRCPYSHLRQKFADDHSVRMSGQQEPHDAQPRFRTNCGKHLRVSGYVAFCRNCVWHNSIILEVSELVKEKPLAARENCVNIWLQYRPDRQAGAREY